MSRNSCTEGNDLRLDDGFGNVWFKCSDRECGLEIVRPGKVQCELCRCTNEQPLRNVDG
jgi:hypothetical protein